MSCANCSSKNSNSTPAPFRADPQTKLSATNMTLPNENPTQPNKVQEVFFNSTTGSQLGYPTCLVSQRPEQGWAASFVINGVNVEVKGVTPEMCIVELVTIVNRNGLQITYHDAWLWLNYFWMGSSPAKRHKVDFVEVANAITNRGFESQAGSALQMIARNWVEDYTPTKWGSIAWKWLGFYLIEETVDLQKFRELVMFISNKLNPKTSPLTGCEDCYKHFVEFEANMPLFNDVYEARKWLWTTHNEVNKRIRKPQLTWIEACQNNMWAYDTKQ